MHGTFMLIESEFIKLIEMLKLFLPCSIYVCFILAMKYSQYGQNLHQ